MDRHSNDPYNLQIRDVLQLGFLRLREKTVTTQTLNVPDDSRFG